MTRYACETLPRGCRRARRGFTLVEILVVMGIIAVLMSIVLPSLNQARRHADRVACASNLRNIGQAFFLYANQHKNKYPPVNAEHPNGPWGNPLSDPGSGKPDGAAIVYATGFFPDPRILYCPSGETSPGNPTASGYRSPPTAPSNLDFWQAATLSGDWGSTGKPSNRTGYAIWVNWNRRFERDDPRKDWFARFMKDRADRIIASDHMIRGTTEAWNGHWMDSRRKISTVPFEGFPPDPMAPGSPGSTVAFEGGNVLHNDGHVVWKNTTETVWRMRPPGGYDVFW